MDKLNTEVRPTRRSLGEPKEDLLCWNLLRTGNPSDEARRTPPLCKHLFELTRGGRCFAKIYISVTQMHCHSTTATECNILFTYLYSYHSSYELRVGVF